MNKRFLFILFFLKANAAFDGWACDLCGCFTPQLEARPAMQMSEARWYAGVSEQFTRFGTLQFDGNEIGNPTGQYLNSSITQLVAGYTISTRFALQLNLPIIHRDFKRPEGFAIDHGTENGPGDIVLLLKSVGWQYASGGRRQFRTDEKSAGKNLVANDSEPDFTASFVLLTGIKFPTGDTDRLTEEFHERQLPDAPESGIHGHDLTLGTGSYDEILGIQGALRYRNLFFEGDLQYAVRGDGAHTFEPANDLVWNAGPGYYFIRQHDFIFGAQFVVSGEHKNRDRFNGEIAGDTGVTSVFLGPHVVASKGHFSVEIGADLPVLIDNTSLQAVAEFRLRGGISVHF